MLAALMRETDLIGLPNGENFDFRQNWESHNGAA
jgi:hypothetical protein